MKDLRTTISGISLGLIIAIKGLMIAYEAGQFTGITGLHLAAAVSVTLLGIFAADSKSSVSE